MKIARNYTMIGLAALASALATPTAFAQSDTTAAPGQDAMQAPAQASAPATPAPAPVAQAKRITWADLDADKDGALSKAETAPVPSLGLVFDEADADADGKLTSDEYKAYVARSGNGAADKQG